MLKRLLLCLLLLPGIANAQFVNGQVLTAAQLNNAFANTLPIAGGILTGPLTVPSLSVTGSPIGLASGGTNCGTASGTCLDNITGFSSTGFLERTGSGAYTFVADPLPVAHGGTGAATATGGTSNLQYLSPLTGASARSLYSKFQDVVSIMDFPGCDQTGATDSTSCIQAAFNSGALACYVPHGAFKYSSLTMPQTVGFTLFGDGPDSELIQTGAGLKYPVVGTASNFDSHQTIRDLEFDGTAGTGHTIDTSYAQTLDLLNLTFNNIPVGHDSLKLDGNVAQSTYMHDVRAQNIRIYSTTAGNAGIELGPYASDSLLDRYIGNGDFATNYMLLADSGAMTTVVSNTHIYNAATNVVKLSGSNNYFGWANDVFDNATSDVFNQIGSTDGRFTNVYVEAVANSHSGIVFNNSYNNNVSGLTCTAASTTATACVNETGGSSGNKVLGAQVDSLSNYTTAFNLTGTGSFVGALQGYSNYGMIYALNGTATTAQAQNTVVYYGANSGQSAPGATSFPVPMAGQVLSASVYFTNTPASGQTFTVSLIHNATTLATVTVNNGSFAAAITLSAPVAVAAGDTLYITITTSATSGSTTPRYSILMQG